MRREDSRDLVVGQLRQAAVQAAMIVAVLLMVFVAFPFSNSMEENAAMPGFTRVKEPSVAGSFYPAGAAELNSTVLGYLGAARGAGLRDVKALVVPHAGYVYSGAVAAEGYKQVDGSPRTIVIMASNHNPDALFSGIALPNYTSFRTPLGEVKVSEMVGRLAGTVPFTFDDKAYESHIIEVQLPFIQELFPGAEIVPMVTGYITEEQVRLAAEAVGSLGADLIVVSSDLSHYNPYQQAVALDRDCVGRLAQVDYSEALGCDMCGLDAARILIKVAEKNGWSAKVIDYKNSGDVPGAGTSSVVGYSAIAFYEPGLSDGDKRILLDIANRSVDAWVRRAETFEPDSPASAGRLAKEGAAFVTLRENGLLRGCIGHLEAVEPLYLSVRDNAIYAASRDPRFRPVSPDELPKMTISVSVLSEPVPGTIDGITPGVHGVILERAGRRATFLPAVWEEIPDKDDFLTQLCLKAGLERDCWTKPDTKVELYTAEEFGQEG